MAQEIRVKKISELELAQEIRDTDLLLVDTPEGTKKIPKNAFLENMKGDKGDKGEKGDTPSITHLEEEVDAFLGNAEANLREFTKEANLTIDKAIEKGDNAVQEALRGFGVDSSNKLEEVTNEINNKLNQVDTSFSNKLNEVDTSLNNKLSQADNTLNNKITEVTNAVNDKIAEVDRAEASIIEAESLRQTEHENRENFLNSFEGQLSQIENKNIEQDTRLKQVEYKNKVQDVYIGGLFNENKDKRLTIEGEGNSLKLEGSKKGLVEVDKVVGDTMVNRCINKSHNFKYGSTPYSRIVDLFRDFNIGKVFTLIADFVDVVIPTGGIKIELTYEDASLGYMTVANNGFIGRTILTVQKTKNVVKARLYVNTDDFIDGVDNTVDNLIILEGDYTNKPIPSEYFEGMQSSFEDCKVTQEMVDSGEELEENLGKYKCEVKVRGKNKFNKSKLLLNTLSTYGGYLYSKESDLTLTITDKNTNVDISNIYFGFSKDGSPSKTNWVVSNGAILLNGVRNNTFDNDKLMFVSFYPKTQNTIDKLTARFNIQLEEGAEATPYEPYVERTQTVYLNSPLLKGDEIVCKEDGLYHYHNKKLRDNLYNLNWVYLSQYDTEDSVVFNTSEVNDYPFNAQASSYNILSDKFIPSSYVVATNKHYSICLMDNLKGLRVRVPKSILTEITPNGFKSWLQSNPTTVVYELAEPYYEKISDDKLLLEIPNNATLSVESVIPCTSISATYTGGIPSLYALEETNANQDNLIDISLMATDEMYMMLEPILEAMPQTIKNERVVSKMVDMYVAMVMRGLKTIDEVPARYREEVKAVLSALEK